MLAPRQVRRLEGWLADAGCRWERVRYPRPAAGGEVSACRFVPRGAARGRVVLAHGAGNDALYPLLALAKPLVAHGFELFCFDLDGHGTESTTTFDIGRIDDALACAVEQAVRDRPEAPLHLVGHSLGGSLVLHALSTGALDQVESAVIISSPIQVTLDFGVGLSELLGFLRMATWSQRAHYGAWGMIPAFGRFRRGAYPLRMTASGPADGTTSSGDARGAWDYVSAVRALLARLDLERAAPRVKVPVLLAYGTRDRLVPHAQGERLARLIPGATLVPVPGASHWSAVWAEETVRHVVQWLDARTPAAT